MPLSLIDLGEDIIVSNICIHLAIKDIEGLSGTCKALREILTTNAVYHLMFLKRFGQDGPARIESYDWRSLFLLHSSRKVSLYTWGSGNNGRLGYLVKDVPPNVRSLRTLGVAYPIKVSNFDGAIIQSVLAGGFSFQVLSDGVVYCTGSSYPIDGPLAPPGPSQKDLADGEKSFLSLKNDNQDKNESKFVFRLKTPPGRTIVSISSGRKHFNALDDQGRVLTWDTGMKTWSVGIYLNFGSMVSRVSKISAGWTSTVCYADSVGLLVVHSRERFTNEDCRENWPTCDAYYTVVPRLKKAVDFVSLDNCVVYIDNLGSIKMHHERHALDYPGETITLIEFDRWLTKHSQARDNATNFTKVVGCFRTFAVFTDDGLILIGRIDGIDTTMVILPDLQGKLIKDVVVGDYHFLAITEAGELLSWGLELQSNGCLGLGRMETLDNYGDNIRREGSGLRVTNPVTVSKPTIGGQWLRVCAAGWHSGALYVEQSH